MNVLSKFVFAVRKFFLARKLKREAIEKVSDGNYPTSLELEQALAYQAVSARILEEAILSTLESYEKLTDDLILSAVEPADLEKMAQKFQSCKGELLSQSIKLAAGNVTLAALFQSADERYKKLIERLNRRAQNMREYRRE